MLQQTFRRLQVLTVTHLNSRERSSDRRWRVGWRPKLCMGLTESHTPLRDYVLESCRNCETVLSCLVSSEACDTVFLYKNASEKGIFRIIAQMVTCMWAADYRRISKIRYCCLSYSYSNADPWTITDHWAVPRRYASRPLLTYGKPTGA